MCGIAGICESESGRPVDEGLLIEVTNKLQHRGPDGIGILTRGGVGLGHRRLSIIDIGGGDQPIFNEDKNIAVVFNGEIYNYIELREDLKRLGHTFHTGSDTEVIVHAYEEYGADCLNYFTGMFTFAIWDGRDNSVFIARDRLGIKPLFFWRRQGRLIFASELKAILADPSFPKEVNIAAVGEYLKWKYIPDGCSILKGIEKLPPAHWMKWQGGKLTLQKYWDAAFTPTDSSMSEQEWKDAIENELRKAVRLRLRADVPLGVFLSGGVDSSGIVALASQELGQKVTTFSVGFGEADYDELHFAKLVADRYNTNHNEIIVTDQSISILSELAYYLDEPFGDPSILPTYYVCREASRHVKVCLSGDGGDEVFAGYRRYQVALKASARYDWIPKNIRKVVSNAGLMLLPVTFWGRGELERLGCAGPAERYEAMMSAFSRHECDFLLPTEGKSRGEEHHFNKYFEHSLGVDLLSRLQYTDQKNYLPFDILSKVDRMSMQNSLEVRVPLLDHNVVGLVNSAPSSLKLKDAQGKYLLKEILRPHLPDEILFRRKMGFGIPIKDWFREGLKSYAHDYLLGVDSRSGRFLSRQGMRKIIEGHAVGMRDFSEKIWVLLMLEHWLRAYDI